MKKISNKGFTLIELLAVITIMGILMMVAIPAVSRTIENSRRDTFATTAGEYLSTVRENVIADNIVCYESGAWRVASANPDGVYYFPICTAINPCHDISLGDGGGTFSTASIAQSTLDLMSTGGKSPFGNAEMIGYVKFEKKTTSVAATGEGVASTKTDIVYNISLVDSGKHGILDLTSEGDLTRSSVLTSTSAPGTNIPSVDGAAPCKMS